MLRADMVQAIVAALPPHDGEAIESREVHRRVDCWSPTTIRNALPVLERDGLASSIKVPIRDGFKRYWKRPTQPVSSAE